MKAFFTWLASSALPFAALAQTDDWAGSTALHWAAHIARGIG